MRATKKLKQETLEALQKNPERVVAIWKDVMDSDEWQHSGAADAEKAALREKGPDYGAFGKQLKKVLRSKKIRSTFMDKFFLAV